MGLNAFESTLARIRVGQPARVLDLRAGCGNITITGHNALAAKLDLAKQSEQLILSSACHPFHAFARVGRPTLREADEHTEACHHNPCACVGDAITTEDGELGIKRGTLIWRMSEAYKACSGIRNMLLFCSHSCTTPVQSASLEMKRYEHE